MVRIKLNHAEIMRKLNQIQNTTRTLRLKTPPSSKLEDNRLEFTDKWEKREANLVQLIDEYVSIVEKNVVDTEANVTSLKDQDEAITR
ncbi:YwqI/YxiC family protein [Aquibacillus rhizosphaerae]|uniref:YwqI/YxiC family protein n=1 Tax=Aquibacillus rhizosphaerae TaxID=3051431 RepID=A0ABT7L3W6_9BACI|nr:YwqI/YxiC family protein [Aquibacillus sp. LR5S19]MDL4840552.1 YwqI/YxiC family protein [Aquibacillus sp. LR5S19]